MELQNIINKILEEFCLKKKCIESFAKKAKKESILCPYLELSSFPLESLTAYFDKLKSKSKETFHVACIVELLRIVYRYTVKKKTFTEGDNKDVFVDTMVALSRKCLEQPDLISPVPVEIECESAKKYENILESNISLTLSCFRFYFDIFFTQFTEVDENGSVKVKIVEPCTDTLINVSSYQKLLLKRTSAKALTVACSRLGDQPWTSDELKESSNNIIQYIRTVSKYDSYSSLLSGSKDQVLFRNGLLGIILNEVIPTFHRDTWKKNVPNMHAILWCLKKITYPNLGNYVSKLVPPLLLLADDYMTDHKLLGILSLSHLIENVIPTDLKLYNHADVIYDALMKQLYSNQGDVYEVTLECLLKLLPVLQSKPAMINHDSFTCWDKTFVKIMNNVDLASKINVELVLLKFIPKFVEQMGGNVIKHIDKVLNLVSLPVQGDGSNVTKKRLFTIRILYTTIQSCWPVVYLYQKQLFKIVFRMLIDLCMATTVGRNSKKDLIEDEIFKVLVLLKMCCPSDAEEAFSSVLALSLDSHFDSVHTIIKKVIETKEV